MECIAKLSTGFLLIECEEITIMQWICVFSIFMVLHFIIDLGSECFLICKAAVAPIPVNYKILKSVVSIIYNV